MDVVGFVSKGCPLNREDLAMRASSTRRAIAESEDMIDAVVDPLLDSARGSNAAQNGQWRL